MIKLLQINKIYMFYLSVICLCTKQEILKIKGENDHAEKNLEHYALRAARLFTVRG